MMRNRMRLVLVFCLLFGASAVLGDGQGLGEPVVLAEGPRRGDALWKTPTSTARRIHWHPGVTGAPAEIAARALAADTLNASSDDPKAIAEAFLDAYGPQLLSAGGASPSPTWDPLRVDKDTLGASHVRYNQRLNGLPVFGAQMIVHIDAGGHVAAANGRFLASGAPATRPVLRRDEAAKRAASAIGCGKHVVREGELVYFNGAVVSSGDDRLHLAYRLRLAGEGANNADIPLDETLLVDAHDGKVLAHYGHILTGRDREIYDLQNRATLPGTLVYDETGPRGSPPADAVAAYAYTGDTYDYYWEVHGRDGYDDRGSTMVASVRYGTTKNAFWNGVQTAYGPEFAVKDVVAHEWTHGVTQYSANLLYGYQPGALNEAFSDIFACMIDRDDWQIGEDLPAEPGENPVVRDLENAYPGKTSDYYCTDYDFGGVHTNCQIPAHAAYLMAEGGAYNGVTVPGIGREATERIHYRVLTAYLLPGAGLRDYYDAVLSACDDLYAGQAAIRAGAEAALQAVELDQPIPCVGEVDPDAHEPDDSWETARWVTVNDPAETHNIHQAGDHDWIKFDAQGGGDYVVQTSNLGANCDTWIDLYDTDGTTRLAYDDDGGGGLSSRLAWTAPSAGTYYVVVYHYRIAKYGEGTAYDLAVTGVPPSVAPDEFEPDDTALNASMLTLDIGQAHTFHDGGDNDWAWFDAVAGTSYQIETLDLGGRCDTVLYLYEGDATTEIERRDDGGDGLASRIWWTAPTTGSYYVRCHQYDGDIYGEGTGYVLRVSPSATDDPDAYEPDDDAASARQLIVNGDAQDHNIHQPGDVDWCHFTAASGAEYVVETFDLDANCDTHLTLYESDGTTVLDSDDDGGEGAASRIAWTATGDGSYYVRARHIQGAVSGPDTGYRLRLTGTAATEADAYEPDNSSGEATPLIAGDQPQTHNAHRAEDIDWLSFASLSGQGYVIETSSLGATSDTMITLYEPDGLTQILQDDDSGEGYGSRIAWTAPNDGTRYVAVRQNQATVYGPETHYDISLTATAVAPDAYEPDDAYENASPLQPDGSAQHHNIHVPRDEDWIGFSAVEGVAYTIETLDLERRCDTMIYLYDVDGTTQLAIDDDGGLGAASRIEWTAPADGVHFVRARHYHDTVYGLETGYRLRILGSSGPEGDAYEPDDDHTTANWIATDGSGQGHDFHDMGDIDWCRMACVPGTVYVVETRHLASRCDTYLSLYDSDGTTELATSDDGGTGWASRLTWTPDISGTYYVAVRHAYPEIYGIDTGYELSVTATDASQGDDQEPDDGPEDATEIIPDGAVLHYSTHAAGNEDWARFDASAGRTYIIETENLGPWCDTYLYLIKPDRETVILRDDDGGVGPASRIEWQASFTDEYYVRIRQYWDDTYGPDSTYDLRITSQGGADAAEPDDSPAQAPWITVDATAQRHNFHTPGDEDWVRFQGQAGTHYLITTSDLAPQCDTVLTLFDAEGATPLAHNDDGGTGWASRIAWQAPESTTYTVRVRHRVPDLYGAHTDYDLAIATASGPDGYEPDDSAANATAIAPGAPAQWHNFHLGGDSDWVTFQTVTNTRYVIETTALESRCDTYLHLLAADGTTELDRNDDWGAEKASRIEWVATDASTLYVRARHYDDWQFGEDTGYRLSLSAHVADDTPVLVWTPFADADQELVNTLAALAQYGEDYVTETCGSINPATLAAALDTHELLLIPEPEEASDALLHSLGGQLATTLQGFVAGGGTVVALCEWDGRQGLLTASGLITTTMVGAYYDDATAFDVALPDHPLAEGLGSTLASASATASYEIGSPGVDAVVTDAAGHAVVAARDLGAGHVVLIGYDYFSYHDDAARLLANALDWARGPLATETATAAAPKTVTVGEAFAIALTLPPGARLKDVVNLAKPEQISTLSSEVEPDGRVLIACRVEPGHAGDTARLPLTVTWQDRGGAMHGQRLDVTVGLAPKIDSVSPTRVSNAHDTVLAINGAGFEPTPKVRLRGIQATVSLVDVRTMWPWAVSATVPAGCKPGTYTLEVENPDDTTATHAPFVVEATTLLRIPLVLSE